MRNPHCGNLTDFTDMNLAIGDSFGDDVLEVVMEVAMVVDVDDKVNINKAMNEESDVVDVLLGVFLR